MSPLIILLNVFTPHSVWKSRAHFAPQKITHTWNTHTKDTAAGLQSKRAEWIAISSVSQNMVVFHRFAWTEEICSQGISWDD